MTIALVINGVTFDYPEQDDENWGPSATDWAAAVTTGMLQKAGGLFTLLADVDFGASYGLKSLYYKSRTANVSDAGQIRLAVTDSLSWRNNANSGNLSLGVNASDLLTFDGSVLYTDGITSLTGDVTGTGPGAAATTISNNVVSNAKLATMAAHTFKGNNTGSTGNALDLTATQLTAELNVMVGDSGSGGTKGLVPAPGVGDATKYLRGDGTFATPLGAGDVVGPASAVANAVALFDGTTGKLIKDGGIGTSSQVLVGGTTPAFGSTPAASLPIVTQSTRGAVSSAGQLLGTNTNDDAASGNVGEFVTQTVSTATDAASSGVNLDLMSVTVPGAGDYDLSVCIVQLTNTAIFTASNQAQIATSVGGSPTTSGLTEFQFNVPSASASSSQSIATSSVIRVKSDGTNVTFNGLDSQASQVIHVYVNATYSSGIPKWRGTISLRRVR